MEDTASRTLLEQTGAQNIFMSQFSVFSNLDRLNRDNDEYQWIKDNGLIHERVVTIGFYSLIKPNQPKKIKLIDRAEWMNVNDTFELIFDHREILNAALKQLSLDMLVHPIIFELLPQKFTLGQLQNLFELILNQKFDKRNFRRKISGMKFLVATDELQEGVAHKPAQLYRFDKKLYNKHKKENFEFIL
jgi:8-oxo-dGTP diphosphatase